MKRRLFLVLLSLVIVKPAAGSVDLIPLLNLSEDVVNGNWQLVSDELIMEGGAVASRLSFPYYPPPEYDYVVVFTITSGADPWDNIAQLVSHGDVPFAWSTNAGTGHYCRLEDIDGHSVIGNPTLTYYPFVDGETYTSIVRVRNDRVICEMNGEVLVEYETDYSDLSRNPKWEMPDQLEIGLGGYGGPTTFHSATVTPIGPTEECGEWVNLGELVNPEEHATDAGWVERDGGYEFSASYPRAYVGLPYDLNESYELVARLNITRSKETVQFLLPVDDAYIKFDIKGDSGNSEAETATMMLSGLTPVRLEWPDQKIIIGQEYEYFFDINIYGPNCQIRILVDNALLYSWNGLLSEITNSISPVHADPSWVELQTAYYTVGFFASLEARECNTFGPACTDEDEDGFAVEGGDCGPIDCDDSHPDVYPSAPELCDYVDNQCGGDTGFGKIDEGCEFSLLSPVDGAQLTSPPTLEWAAGEYDYFLFYSVFPYAGLGYFPVRFAWFPQSSIAITPGWWDALEVDLPCYWGIVGYDLDTSELAGLAPWTFTKTSE